MTKIQTVSGLDDDDKDSQVEVVKNPEAEVVGKLLPVPSDLREVKDAVEKLTENVAKRYKDPNCLTLMMFVNLDNAKASLVPIPGKENLQKYNRDLYKLPENIRNVIMKSLPEDDKNALETIWQYLESQDQASAMTAHTANLQLDKGKKIPQVAPIIPAEGIK